MGFKENLKDEMQYQDVKIKELSDKTSISENTLRNYINGHNALPNIYSAVKIAKVLNITVEELVNGRIAKMNMNKSSLDNEQASKFLSIFLALNTNDKLSVMALMQEMKKHY